jgi:hypothetical protein
MNLRLLRAECAAKLNGLDLPTPFDLAAFCERLGQRRGRSIHLRAVPLPADSPSGMLVSTLTADHVLYQANTTPLHQEQIVLHEIGHLLWEHAAGHTVTDQSFRLLLPALDSSAIQCILGRDGCSGAEEQQAELMATVILQKVAAWTRTQPRLVPDSYADTISRLRHTLEHPDRHS